MRNVFLDCGAWTGNSIAHFRACFTRGDEYTVYSFECHPQSIGSYKQMVQGTQLIEAAVWTYDGEIKLRTCKGKWVEGCSIVPEKKMKGEYSFVKVPCIDFARWLKENIKSDDHVICKLNIEGAEYELIHHLLNTGTADLIKEWYIAWHWNKMGMSESAHKRIADRIKWKPWKLPHGRRAVYTVITGDHGYKLREPLHENKNWDFICFTDRKNLQSDRWQIRSINRMGLDDKKLSRRPKILVHEYLPDYYQTLYLDTRFTVKYNLDKFTGPISGAELVMMTHNRRNCVYDEAKVLGIENSEQIRRYMRLGMPRHYGLWAPGIMFRRGHSKQLIAMMQTWWNEVARGSYRDIPALAYAMWIHSDVARRYWPFKKTYDLFMDRSNR